MADNETGTPATGTNIWEQTLAGEGLTPDQVKEKLDHSRKWEQRAKDNHAKVEALETEKAALQQQINEAAETAASEKAELGTELTRLRVALRKGIPEDLIDRLRGDDEDELEADADKLLSFVSTPATGDAPGPRPDLSQGARGNGDPSTADQFAGAIRGFLNQ
jgi:L-lactate utilization protein LutC